MKVLFTPCCALVDAVQLLLLLLYVQGYHSAAPEGAANSAQHCF